MLAKLIKAVSFFGPLMTVLAPRGRSAFKVTTATIDMICTFQTDYIKMISFGIGLCLADMCSGKWLGCMTVATRTGKLLLLASVTFCTTLFANTVAETMMMTVRTIGKPEMQFMVILYTAEILRQSIDLHEFRKLFSFAEWTKGEKQQQYEDNLQKPPYFIFHT
jgi:hypothetical protein